MKKIIVFLGMLLFVAGLNAQQQARMNASEMVSNRLFIGLGGAFTGTVITQQNFYGEPELDYAAKYGNVFSFSTGYILNEHVGFETGISFSKQGVAYADVKQQGTFVFKNSAGGYDSLSAKFTDVARDITTNYLNIPVLLRLDFGAPENRSKFRVLLGPQFSFLRSATQVYTRVPANTGGSAAPTETYIKDTEGKWFSVTEPDISDRISKNDIQVVFDIGSDFLIGNHLMLSTGIRANYGFKDVNTEPYRLESHKDGVYVESKNLYGGIYLSLNYLIPLN